LNSLSNSYYITTENQEKTLIYRASPSAVAGD
jgi:hypothetical protein